MEKTRKIQESRVSKAKVQAYLATRKRTVSSLGVAAQRSYWNFENSCFYDIKRFLHNLFSKGVYN